MLSIMDEMKFKEKYIMQTLKITEMEICHQAGGMNCLFESLKYLVGMKINSCWKQLLSILANTVHSSLRDETIWLVQQWKNLRSPIHSYTGLMFGYILEYWLPTGTKYTEMNLDVLYCFNNTTNMHINRGRGKRKVV